jgi:hypothetical protein
LAHLLAIGTVAVVVGLPALMAYCMFFCKCESCEERKKRMIQMKEDVALWLAKEKAKEHPIFFFIFRKKM